MRHFTMVGLVLSVMIGADTLATAATPVCADIHSGTPEVVHLTIYPTTVTPTLFTLAGIGYDQTGDIMLLHGIAFTFDDVTRVSLTGAFVPPIPASSLPVGQRSHDLSLAFEDTVGWTGYVDGQWADITIVDCP